MPSDASGVVDVFVHDRRCARPTSAVPATRFAIIMTIWLTTWPVSVARWLIPAGAGGPIVRNVEQSDKAWQSAPHGPPWLLPGALLPGAGPVRARRTTRDWVVDTLTFGGALLLGLVVCGLVQKYDHPSDWFLAADLLLGTLACLSLWWRRRFPLTVALLAVPAVALSSSAFGAGILITVNLALRLPWRRSLAVLALYLAAGLLGGLFLEDQQSNGPFGAALTLAYYLGSFAWGSTLRTRRLGALAVRREAELERADHARRLADARREERAAIAREMHDVLAHRISLLSVHAGALAYRAEQSAAGAGRDLTGTEICRSSRIIRDSAHQALSELHDVLRVLRTKEDGDSEPMAAQMRLADLPGLVEEACSAGQEVALRNELADRDAAGPPRPQCERTVYRVVQEGLTNARKHAPGAPVTVELTGAPGAGLTVCLSNRMPTARPAPQIPGTGTGLTGLAERVRLDGGLLAHGSDGRTFTLRVQLPWPVR